MGPADASKLISISSPSGIESGLERNNDVFLFEEYLLVFDLEELSSLDSGAYDTLGVRLKGLKLLDEVVGGVDPPIRRASGKPFGGGIGGVPGVPARSVPGMSVGDRLFRLIVLSAGETTPEPPAEYNLT